MTTKELHQYKNMPINYLSAWVCCVSAYGLEKKDQHCLEQMDKASVLPRENMDSSRVSVLCECPRTLIKK